MQPEVLPIIGAAMVASIVAIAAAVLDRCNKPSATICALLAGGVFWIHVLSWYTKIPNLAGGIGLFAGAPLFVIAAYLFKSVWRGKPSTLAATLSYIGVFAGGVSTYLTIRLMAEIP